MLKITTELHNRTFYSDEVKKQIRSQQNSDLKESPYYRNRKLFQLDVNYRWSSIVFDERYPEVSQSTERSAYGTAGHDLRAGDRAPDAPGLVQIAPNNCDKTISNLFDLFKSTKHTALVFASAPLLEEALLLLVPFHRIGPDLLQTAIILPLNTDEPIFSSCPADFVFKDSNGHAF